MTRSRTLLPALVGATALVFTAALPATAGHRPGATVYRADLQEVADNDADGTPTGTVTIVQKGDRLRVNLDAEGLDEGLHLSHVHGVIEASNECPGADADGGTVDDGLVDLVEGAPAYGPVLLALGADEGTAFDYSRTFTETDDPLGLNPSGVPLDEIGSLEQYHVVVHGVDVDGDGDLDGQQDLNGDGVIGDSGNPVVDLAEGAFELSMPALCGEIVKISN